MSLPGQPTARWFRVLLLAGLVACACGAQKEKEASDGALVDVDADLGCAGTPPQIEDCPRGYFFAECGGTGEPRLACAPGVDNRPDDCYWFTGGCVARGFEPSTCAASDVCCHEALYGGGRWPYPDGRFIEHTLYDRLYGFGVRPWDRAREMALEVTIDPTLTADIVPVWTTCEGSSRILESGGPPCQTPGDVSARLGATLSILSQYRGAGGWNPLIEIDPSTALARVCAYLYTDAYSADCPASEAICADAGTVALDRLPSAAAELPGLAVAVDVTFERGAYHLAGSFAVP